MLVGLRQRTASITTRIETSNNFVRPRTNIRSENSIHYNKDWDFSLFSIFLPSSCQRTASITTRIETFSRRIVVLMLPRQRTASITTRIETPKGFLLVQWEVVREQHPLQQGLRHLSDEESAILLMSENSIHYNKDWDSSCQVLVEHSQGCQRTASITTRIETNSSSLPTITSPVREQHPLQQGLRLNNSISIYPAMESENSIHYNKDWDTKQGR